MEKLKRKVLGIFTLVMFFSLVFSLLRQIVIFRRMNERLTRKRAELSKLETENQRLKARLEEVNSLQFLKEQAKKILGGETVEEKEKNFPDLRVERKELPNYQKWWRLFVP